MTSVLPAGRYKQKKEWSTGSIPELVSSSVADSNANEEDIENSDPVSGDNQQQSSNIEIQVNGIPQQFNSARRSSLAVGLFPGERNNNDSDEDRKFKEQIAAASGKHGKRRSSIAVAFLGRKDNAKSKNEEPAKRSSIFYNNNNNDNDDANSDYYLSDKDPRRKRRSSWQAKLERRRRKSLANTRIDENSVAVDMAGNEDDIDEQDIDEEGGSGSSRYMDRGVGLPMGAGGGYHRQKRHSWWNILVPDNLKARSRRSSQDVGMFTRSTENVRPFRSKSRSVDHGLAPFDLDNLKSTVEGRIDSVERLRAEAKKIPTMTYTVGDRDTLTSVAARFDTTPSELTSLNRLVGSFVYPGQQLLVPDKDKIVEGSETASDKSSPVNGSRDNLQDEKELLDGLRPTSPKPGHIERVAPEHHAAKEDDPVITQRFLKINVRHITDGQGVVGGVLLVTPNAVMFDPNVSDPLVIDRGPENYGVIAPMELVVNAAIFHDIAHMRVGNEQSSEKPDVYYPKPPTPQPHARFDGSHSPGNDSLLVKDETFPELGASSVDCGDDQESICSSHDREGAAFPKAFDRDLVTPTTLNRDAADTKDNNDKESKSDDLEVDLKSQAERRKSLLDHHWAIPSKDRYSNCNNTNSQHSHDEEEEEGQADGEDVKKKDAEEEGEASAAAAPAAAAPPAEELTVAQKLEEAIMTNILPKLIHPAAETSDNENTDKLSCHDSGIDIRDPAILQQLLPQLQQNKLPQAPPKKYSDADIVLSDDWVPPIPLATPLGGSSHLSADPGAGDRKKTSSVSFSVDEAEPQHPAHDKGSTGGGGGMDKKNKMLKRLSYPLAWVEGLTGETNKSSDSTESAPNTGDSNQSVFSKVFSRRSSIGTFIRPHSSDANNSGSAAGAPSSGGKAFKVPAPRLDYRSMVSIDDMPELFASFDKLIPRPARACQDPPLYLRLRMGRPMGKAPPLPTSVMSYGKNKLRPEYWFSIPKNRVDELFRFLNSWVPQLYGELEDAKVKEMGYELIEHDTEWAQDGIQKMSRSSIDGEDIAGMTRESWEASKNVLSMSADDYRKGSLFLGESIEVEFTLPDLVGQTEILTEEHREKLCGHLPARAEGYSWSLVFSTSLHGFSLNSLYRKMYKLESPILVVIQDTDNNVFGALTSCSLHVSDHFYGTGESLLFKFNPSFKVFHWTGENLYFIKGNPESLSIGSGDGKFGLWLDGDLNQGRTQPCSTYANEPLAPREDFVVKTIECWAFV